MSGTTDTCTKALETQETATIVPPERLASKRRERQERKDRWPPESPLYGEDLEAEMHELRQRKR